MALSAAAKKYLKVYNAISGLLWALVLLRVIFLYAIVGPQYVAEGMSDFVIAVQSLAVLEVVHAALGLVRSSIVTTAMQVASRLVLVWGICYLFPTATTTIAFSSMVFAWGVTETIRYPYYWCGLQYRKVPEMLERVRYTAFIVLYPLGAGSEMLCILRALPAARRWNNYYALYLKLLLIIYPPSFYFLYTHMWSQRRKSLAKLNSMKTA